MDSIWYRLIHYGLEFFGRYYSSYRGFVVDNEDPEGMNRVKVIMPTIHPYDKVGEWAYPINNWGGENYGSHCLPQKGDMVWLSFEHGNPEFPLWQHAGYATGEKPEEFNSSNVYGFKTPKGNLVIIDDADEGKILIKYKSGKEYFLTQTDLIELESAGLIKLGKNGDEFALMGNTTKNKLDVLINLILTHTHPVITEGAPTGPPVNASDFTQLKSSLSDILSEKVKLDKGGPTT
jgi:hypothetical protein